MTFQQPPPPPPGAPPPPPPGGGQPPGQWGPPPGGNPYGPSGSNFDPKTVNPLDWGILGAGLLAFIFSFVSYYSYQVKVSGIGSATGHVNAWHGFFGWFGMLLALVGSGLVAVALFAPDVKMPVPARLAGLGAYALATLCLILALFIVPGDTGGTSAFGVHVDKGHGVGYWISLIVVIAGLVLSLMRFQQSGGQLPGALNRMPNIGGHPGAPPPPPPGYGQPPPPAGGYGPPAP